MEKQKSSSLLFLRDDSLHMLTHVMGSEFVFLEIFTQSSYCSYF